MLLSLLIPTLKSRETIFESLRQDLMEQIHRERLNDQVQILSFCDEKEHSVGFKRNRLIAQAQGKFVAFVDDDDKVSDDYVFQICSVLRESPDIDCVGIKGIISFSGKAERMFIHSLQYTDYFSRKGVYFRPPYHLNPIRTEIAKKYPFEDISYSEDIDWAMRMVQDRALKKEYYIDKVIYYYHCRRSLFYQNLLDHTEFIRHMLGLRLSNRLRLQRWLKAFLS